MRKSSIPVRESMDAVNDFQVKIQPFDINVIEVVRLVISNQWRVWMRKPGSVS